MVTTFPVNTIALIVASMFGVGIAAWFALSQGIRRVSAPGPAKQAWRWSAAIILAAWFITRLVLSATLPANKNQPVIIAFAVAGMLVGLLPLLFSPAFRQIVRAVPQTWLVGVQVTRVLGVLFLALFDMGLLPGQFALTAGYGDLGAGLMALGVVYLLAKRKPYGRSLAVAWNLYGLLDFVVANITGPIFIGPHALQVAAAGISTQYLNYVFIIPSFGVPVYALLHIYSLYQLLFQRAASDQKLAQQPV